MNKKKILMIDDEVDFCRMTKRNLEAAGDFIVEFATDSQKGIKLARQIKPDLILLDLRMPRIDGFGVLEALKKDFKTMSIPVVMLTALDTDDLKNKATSLYSEDYLVKPVEISELKAKIEAVLKLKSFP